jgi:hypothetical protein
MPQPLARAVSAANAIAAGDLTIKLDADSKDEAGHEPSPPPQHKSPSPRRAFRKARAPRRSRLKGPPPALER